MTPLPLIPGLGDNMNNNKPFDHEIESQRNLAAINKNSVTMPSVDYAYYEGVLAALDWVLGNVEYSPMEK